MTDLEINQALKVVTQILEPDKLNVVEELVLRECWLGKTYQEIAAISGYDSDYVRVVGSRLWQNLTLVFETKISKNNFKSIFREQVFQGKFSLSTIEFPQGQVPLQSNLYIERPPWDTQACEEILNPGALVVIESPLNMGKTSLMNRILAKARSQNYQTVTLNLQLAEVSILSNLEKFLRWMMANITHQLGINSEIDHYWDQDLGSKVSCTNYMQQYILAQLSEPLVIAFDEINYLFAYPEIAQEVLPLLRYWHEEAHNLDVWQDLRMIVVHSTDVYIPYEIHQSPLNLGLQINLPEFNFAQVKELASLHQLRIASPDLEDSLKTLMDMVGGFPCLIREALYALSREKLTLEQLLESAPTSSGIYYSHLQRYAFILNEHSELMAAYSKIVAADTPIQVSSLISQKLSSIGLVKLSGNQVFPSCQLYRLYFRDYLTV